MLEKRFHKFDWTYSVAITNFSFHGFLFRCAISPDIHLADLQESFCWGTPVVKQTIKRIFFLLKSKPRSQHPSVSFSGPKGSLSWSPGLFQFTAAGLSDAISPPPLLFFRLPDFSSQHAPPRKVSNYIFLFFNTGLNFSEAHCDPASRQSFSHSSAPTFYSRRLPCIFLGIVYLILWNTRSIRNVAAIIAPK